MHGDRSVVRTATLLGGVALVANAGLVYEILGALEPAVVWA